MRETKRRKTPEDLRETQRRKTPKDKEQWESRASMVIPNRHGIQEGAEIEDYLPTPTVIFNRQKEAKGGRNERLSADSPSHFQLTS